VERGKLGAGYIPTLLSLNLNKGKVVPPGFEYWEVCLCVRVPLLLPKISNLTQFLQPLGGSTSVYNVSSEGMWLIGDSRELGWGMLSGFFSNLNPTVQCQL
jgi:hypothetical protein